MSRLKTFAVVAAIAAALTMLQPRPAEAGSGGVIAGIAIGVIGAALLHHHHRAYAYPYQRKHYYVRPHSFFHHGGYYRHHRGHHRHWKRY